MIRTIEGVPIKCNLQELAVPSFNMGAITSGDSELQSKPTGSLGEFNHIGRNELQKAYTTPAGQLPVGVGQNNTTTGEPHFNGEFWDSNQNDIDSSDVNQMADMLKQRGVEHVDSNILDQLRSGYDWEFNHLTKKDKFTAMTITVDHLATNPRYYDELDNVIVNEGEGMTEMWIGNIPKDRLKIDNGWPAGPKKSKKDDDEEKETEVVEEVKADRIIHHVKAMNEMIEAGSGRSILSNFYVAELDAEFERRTRNHPRCSKAVLLEAINTIVQEEEDSFWSNMLLESPAVPFTNERFKQFRRRVISQIKAGRFNQRIRKIVETKDSVIDESDIEAGADAAFGDFVSPFSPLKEDDSTGLEPISGSVTFASTYTQMDEMSTSAGAGAFSSANWVSKDPRGNVKSAETLGMKLTQGRKYKQDPHYWRKHHRVDPRNKFGKTRDVLGTDGRKLDNVDEGIKLFKKLPTEAQAELVQKLKKAKFIFEVRQLIEELKKNRPMLENSFEPGISGVAGVSNYQTPLNTQNSAFQSPDHFGNAESPNTETSGSLNGAVDKQNQPEIGNEETNWSSHSYNECSYPRREDGALAIEHNGQRFHLSKIVQGTGFKASQ